MFVEKFDIDAAVGDKITCQVGDTYYTAEILRDDDCTIDSDDSHSTDQSVTGCDDEQFDRLLEARACWKRDEWFYCGIVIHAERDGWTKSFMEQLWGIECNYPDADNDYLTVVANQLLAEIID